MLSVTVLALRVRSGAVPTRPIEVAFAERLKNLIFGKLIADGLMMASAKFRPLTLKPTALLAIGGAVFGAGSVLQSSLL